MSTIFQQTCPLLIGSAILFFFIPVIESFLKFYILKIFLFKIRQILL